jgi:hypothetical protein
VIFTVGVGYALMFCMNLWLLGTLMGDLRPSSYAAERNDSEEQSEPPVKKPSQIPALIQNPLAKVAALKNSITSRGESKSAVTNAPTPTPHQPADDVAKIFSVKSVIRSARNSSVVIHTGVKSYTLFVGDRVAMKTPKGEMAGPLRRTR